MPPIVEGGAGMDEDAVRAVQLDYVRALLERLRSRSVLDTVGDLCDRIERVLGLSGDGSLPAFMFSRILDEALGAVDAIIRGELADRWKVFADETKAAMLAAERDHGAQLLTEARVQFETWVAGAAGFHEAIDTPIVDAPFVECGFAKRPGRRCTRPKGHQGMHDAKGEAEPQAPANTAHRRLTAVRPPIPPPGVTERCPQPGCWGELVTQPDGGLLCAFCKKPPVLVRLSDDSR